jgi:nitrilase
VVVGDDATQRLAAAAAEGDLWVAIGITERATESATLYNSLLYLTPDGRVAGCHRKLTPTGVERIVWGQGDGSTLHALDTDIGRVGGLICWENLMPLARAAMYGQASTSTWHRRGTTTMHGCRRCATSPVRAASTCSARTPVSTAATYRARSTRWPSSTAATTPGCPAATRRSSRPPDGSVIAGPLVGETGILFASIERAAVQAARSRFDVVGHYARPDVLRLVVDDEPEVPVRFTARQTPLNVPPSP